MREGRFGHAVDDGEPFGVLHPLKYGNYGAPRHVDASGRDNRWNCHTLMFHFCAPRKGATEDGAIVMVVSEVDARALAVVGGWRIRTMEAVWALTGRPSCKFDRSNLCYIGSQYTYAYVKATSPQNSVSESMVV